MFGTYNNDSMMRDDIMSDLVRDLRDNDDSVIESIGQRLDDIVPVTRFRDAAGHIVESLDISDPRARRHLAGRISAAAIHAHTVGLTA